jgi:4-amino-4-deoxy-L-arabinose transferase-like glycosyltransferase
VHHGPWYQYFADFTTGFLPWSLFVPGAVALAWMACCGAKDRLREARAADTPDGQAPAPFLFPLCWFVAGFVFFSLSPGKRAAYLLPLYPAAALLVGWMWAQAIAEGRRSRWIAVPVALLAGVAALLAGAAAVQALGVLVLPRRLIPGRMVDTLMPADPCGRSQPPWCHRRGRGGLADARRAVPG